MPGICAISVLLILYGMTVLCYDTIQDLKPMQEFSSSGDKIDRMAHEVGLLRASMETLKVRSEFHESLFKEHFDKSQNNVEIQESSLGLDLPEWIASDCAEALARTQQSGIYTVKLRNYGPPFQVYCDANTFGGNWTVVQRRQDGSVEFYRNWTEYKYGFGDLNGEFFIGLDKLYALTAESPQELLIELEDFENEVRYARYNAFAIGAEDTDYKMHLLGTYSGNANDSLTYHKNMKFSTKDRDNDNRPQASCAQKYKGAWWYNDCSKSNLNGLYLNGQHNQFGEGIEWLYWRGEYYSFKRVQMLIRPKY